MNTLQPPSPVRGRPLLLVSPDSTLPALFDMVARLALQGPLCVLDGGNVFQGYPLARSLRRQALPDVHSAEALQAAALQRVLLSRVFTCYQMAAFLQQERGETMPVLVLDFLASFYDQGVRAADRRRLLRACLCQLHGLGRQAPVAIWVRQRAVIPEEGLGFLEMVQAAAGQVWYPPRRAALPAAQQLALFS